MTTPHIRILSHMPNSIGGMLVHADEVVHAGTGNAHVPNAAPALANVTTCATNLRTTQAAMKTTKGLSAPRNDAFVALKNAIHAVEHLTEMAADADLSLPRSRGQVAYAALERAQYINTPSIGLLQSIVEWRRWRL